MVSLQYIHQTCHASSTTIFQNLQPQTTNISQNHIKANETYKLSQNHAEPKLECTCIQATISASSKCLLTLLAKDPSKTIYGQIRIAVGHTTHKLLKPSSNPIPQLFAYHANLNKLMTERKTQPNDIHLKFIAVKAR